MKDNVVSLEEYLKKRFGLSDNEDVFSEIMNKDFMERPELLKMYRFFLAFKYKLSVHMLFYIDNVTKSSDAGFVVSFSEEDADNKTKQILEAVEWCGKTPVLLDARNKTVFEFGQQLNGDYFNTKSEVYNAIIRDLLHSDKVLIIKEISKLKTNQKKDALARGFIKARDDAKIIPKSGLIFIDNAVFLQKAGDNIGPYLNVML